jgi:maltose-binding protein MalE
MPSFSTKDEKVFVNYNYFVVNKNTKNSNLAFNLLLYMTKDE